MSSGNSGRRCRNSSMVDGMLASVMVLGPLSAQCIGTESHSANQVVVLDIH